MKEMFRLVFVLTLVSLIAGVLLAVTQKYTAEPIRATEQAQLFESLNAVLPPSDGTPLALHLPAAGGGTNTFYAARKDNALAGIAFTCVSANGYGGPVEVLVGLTPEGAIHKLKIVRQSETPGLGSKIETPAYLAQFTGKPLAGTVWKVRKDGGAIDAVSGATISSRALCDALSNGLKLYQDNKEALLAAAAAPATTPAP
jgi:electron transport complex protein RnfG